MRMEVIPALAAWVVTAACRYDPVANSAIGGSLCEHGSAGPAGLHLSSGAQTFRAGSAGYRNATARWNHKDAPHPDWVVVPRTEQDVALTVQYANAKGTPFLAISGRHGAMSSLGKMDSGIGIWLDELNKVEVSKDGKTATIAGGALSKTVIDALWAKGKQTVTGACECTGFISPGLGGGHGWLQGHRGLISDQWLSANIVTADGQLRTIDSNSDLWWAIGGAGHNFGIVTSVTSKVYDIEHRDWAHATYMFNGDNVEELYKRVNEHHLKNGTQPEGLVNWSYWMNLAMIDPKNPIILMYILQEGVTKVDEQYTKPFDELKPLNVDTGAGTYLDLPAWTAIDIDGPPCQKVGMSNLRYPIDVDNYNTGAVKKAWDVFSTKAQQGTPFNNSLFLFEGYSTQGVKAMPREKSAYAFRDDNLLIAPLITYEPGDAALDKAANDLGIELREIIHDGTGRDEIHAYVNYAFPGNTKKEWYGYEQWRQEKLLALKNKYDPQRKFSFFGPIA